MSPPFSITAAMLSDIAQVERLIGRIEGLSQQRPQPHLRKTNRVKTVQGSLAIEGNTLDLDQVSAVLEGKVVIGAKNEIQEVINANAVYEAIGTYDPFSATDLRKAHGVMMRDLLSSAGNWRSGNVGIIANDKVSHVAPPADRVHFLMEELFEFLRAGEQHPLIAGCVFHYELEFIHPFEDGNGRIGRFWHSLLLYHYHPVFEFIPVESLIREHQQDYYQALGVSDQAGHSTAFVEFSLSIIRQTLEAFLDALQPEPMTSASRLELARGDFSEKKFSRADYLKLIKTISTATASRDLKWGVDHGWLDKTGERALTVYQFKQLPSG